MVTKGTARSPALCRADAQPPCARCPQIGAVSTPTANVSQRLEHAPEGQKLEILVALISSEVQTRMRGEGVHDCATCRREEEVAKTH